MQEEPDAVPAHLGMGPVGVAVVHEPLAAVQLRPEDVGRIRDVAAAHHPEDAVTARPGPAIAEPRDHRRVQPVLRPHRAVGVGEHHEVVLGAVPEQHAGR